jgi:hypothetical protein
MANIAVKAFGIALDRLADGKFRRLAEKYDQKIYNVHIRKSAGTSLNMAMLSLGDEDGAIVYGRLAATPGHRVVSGGKAFAAWRKRNIEAGDYFYAFSHCPFHALKLPRDVTTITCLRDPVDRVLSAYWEYKKFQTGNVSHDIMKVVGGWLGESFSDFLQRAPRDELCGQLAMFSETLNVDEASDRIASLSHVLFFNNLDEDVARLGKALDLPIILNHMRKTNFKTGIAQTDVERLRDMLAPEYRMLERVRAAMGSNLTPLRPAPPPYRQETSPHELSLARRV